MPSRQSASRTPRAERYPLTMPLRLRRESAPAWRSGRTCNVSLTGVLARVDGGDLDVGTPVEMVLGVSDEEPGARHVVCVGRVVRVESPSDERCLAVTIDRYKEN
jgi:PilZ domain